MPLALCTFALPRMWIAEYIWSGAHVGLHWVHNMFINFLAPERWSVWRFNLSYPTKSRRCIRSCNRDNRMSCHPELSFCDKRADYCHWKARWNSWGRWGGKLVRSVFDVISICDLKQLKLNWNFKYISLFLYQTPFARKYYVKLKYS